MFKRIFLLVILMYSSLPEIKAFPDTTSVGSLNDSLPEYKSFRGTDSVVYVLIDSLFISDPGFIRNKVMLKYPQGDYNYLNATYSHSSASVFQNNILLRRQPDQWIVYVLLSIAVFFAFVKNLFSKNLPLVFQAYWSDRVISQFTRDDNFFKMRNSIVYFILYCLISGLMVLNILEYFGKDVPYTGLNAYWFTTAAVFGFYFLKYVMMKLAGYVFSIQKMISGYLSIISVSNLVFVLLMMPMLLFYQYLPGYYASFLMYLMLIFFAFNTFYKYLRSGSFIISNFQFPKFYLIIYLCTLEIMPLLIIYKMFLVR